MKYTVYENQVQPLPGSEGDEAGEINLGAEIHCMNMSATGAGKWRDERSNFGVRNKLTC